MNFTFLGARFYVPINTVGLFFWGVVKILELLDLFPGFILCVVRADPGQPLSRPELAPLLVRQYP